MEKQQKREMDRMYTVFWGEDVDTEDYSVRVVLHHLPSGLLRSSVSCVDREQLWQCEHTGKKRLSDFCAEKELGNEELRWIYGSILNNLKETQEFLLDMNHLLFEANEVYLDEEYGRVWNTYIPFYEKDIWDSLKDFAQYLLGHIDQEDTEAVRIAYGMYRYFNQNYCNIEGAWKVLCDLQKGNDFLPENTLDEDGEILTEEYEEPEEKEEKTSFPIASWIVMSLSAAAAIFFLGYVGFNDWYLSNKRKVLLLALSVILGTASVFLWNRIKGSLKKKNPLEEVL